ncbi:MAG: alpha/beta hydrolase [Nitrospirales bacterium]|nr:alpha/beta hydrolase [Nitrospira sp.]MDR4501137.1 alpha/beta hydrolase [Nitrospirales bacterium]
MTKFFKYVVWLSSVGILIILAGTYWMGTQLTAPAHTRISPSSFVPRPQSIQFLDPSGKQLAGWLVPGNPACGTVILMHAVRSNRLGMASRVPFLHDAGYSVLLFDFQAHGESEGETITYGALEKEDVRAAIQYVRQGNPSSQIGLIGFSLGGTAAVLTDASLQADVLILEAVFSTLDQAIVNRVRQKVGLLAPLLAYPLLWHFHFFYGIDPAGLRPIDAIHSLPVPTLVIGGTDDQHTLRSETEALFSQAQSPKELWLITGARHQDFHLYAPAEYETRVRAFLNTHLHCPQTSSALQSDSLSSKEFTP